MPIYAISACSACGVSCTQRQLEVFARAITSTNVTCVRHAPLRNHRKGKKENGERRERDVCVCVCVVYCVCVYGYA